MIVEEVFDKQYTPPTQRRPKGQVKRGSTKKGNKKRGLRTRSVRLLSEDESSDDDEESDWPVSSGRPRSTNTPAQPAWFVKSESVWTSWWVSIGDRYSLFGIDGDIHAGGVAAGR
jgi:hypothetical protein